MEINKVREGPIAIAVDTSCQALKWVVEHYIPRGGTIKLVHVNQKSSTILNVNGPSNDDELSERRHNVTRTNQLLPMQCFCIRKNIQSEVVLLEDQDVAKALIEYISQNGISTFVLGASLKNSITRLFKVDDLSNNVMRWAPDFCTVLVISKGRLSSVRAATRPFPQALPSPSSGTTPLNKTNVDEAPFEMSLSREDDIFFEEFSSLETNANVNITNRISTDSSILSFYEKLGAPHMLEFPRSFSGMSQEKSKFSIYLNSPSDEKKYTLASSLDDTDAEKIRLKKELKETMNMYHAACKEALIAKERVRELEKWKKKAEERLQMAEEAAKMAIRKMETTSGFV